MNPKISIVIPLYNKEHYIQRTIDSVLRQTFQDFECIIVDSSDDDSTELVDNYNDSRIIHITRERTKAAAARNLGYRNADTDFIAFLDADDEWLPDHLETLMGIKKRFPDAGLFSTPYIKLKPDGSPMVMLFAGIPRPPWEGYVPDYLMSCSRGDEPVNSSSCAVPRDILDSMGGFPEGFVYGEDQFLWGKISLFHPVAYSWKGLTIYHTEAEGRVCDKAHKVSEHPFSAYLRQQLEKGLIPPEKQGTCRAYIRRKRLAEIFSLLTCRSLTSSDENDPSIVLGKGAGIRTGDSHHFTEKINQPLGRLYHSSLHDAIRRCLFRIYGCYNPALELNASERNQP